jgi:hypothetical protein
MQKQIDVANGFATDWQIAAEIRRTQDDKGFRLTSGAVVRLDTVASNPRPSRRSSVCADRQCDDAEPTVRSRSTEGSRAGWRPVPQGQGVSLTSAPGRRRRQAGRHHRRRRVLARRAGSLAPRSPPGWRPLDRRALCRRRPRVYGLNTGLGAAVDTALPRTRSRLPAPGRDGARGGVGGFLAPTKSGRPCSCAWSASRGASGLSPASPSSFATCWTRPCTPRAPDRNIGPGT